MATTSTGHVHYHYHNYHRTMVANLTKLIDVELDLLEESFEEAKRRIDPVITLINQARDKFRQLLQQGGGGGETMMEMGVERELRDLKQETSKLKLKIPFNLIAPEYQPAADPNVILQPRTRPSEATSSNPIVVVDIDELVDPFSRHRPFSNSDRSPILRCFLAFPEGAFIKASLLCSYVNATVFALQKRKLTVLEDIVLTASELVSEGFIKSVSKKHSSTSVYGFWMDPSVRHALKEHLYRESFLRRGVRSLVNSTSINGEDIIYSGSADVSTLSSDVEFLHLGKWQSYPTHLIEMPDPNLYFKNTGPLLHLTYISFRGVSVMKELPDILTHSRYLMILDLKACHHLEVLPSNIGNLWGWLAHLDMSECYFLDHMPSSLSRLTGLHVLKGFFVGETNNDEECCTLQDLFSMEYLKKLNIYTSLKTFPNENHLTTLQGFEYLCNLTICWGGCPTRVQNREFRKSPAIRLKRLVTRGPDHTVVRVDKKFSFSLDKLDLRGAPEMGTRNWLKPSNFEQLQKLYIRGGQLSHLRNNDEAQKDKQLAPVKEKGWSVKMLRLRHLSKLQMDWSELQDSFPNVSDEGGGLTSGILKAVSHYNGTVGNHGNLRNTALFYFNVVKKRGFEDEYIVCLMPPSAPAQPEEDDSVALQGLFFGGLFDDIGASIAGHGRPRRYERQTWDFYNCLGMLTPANSSELFLKLSNHSCLWGVARKKRIFLSYALHQVSNQLLVEDQVRTHNLHLSHVPAANVAALDLADGNFEVAKSNFTAAKARRAAANTAANTAAVNVARANFAAANTAVNVARATVAAAGRWTELAHTSLERQRLLKKVLWYRVPLGQAHSYYNDTVSFSRYICNVFKHTPKGDGGLISDYEVEFFFRRNFPFIL